MVERKQSWRALIVEDDRSWQAILSEMIEDAGLQVDVADGVESALEAVHAGEHHLAVVDLSLDESDHNNRDGLRVLDALRRHDPDCISILLTGYATVELAVSALTEYRAFTCLRKETFQRAQFRDLLVKVLSGSGVAAEKISQPLSGKELPGVEAGQSGSGRAGLALVAEDDEGWRNILVELLSGQGFAVLAAANFSEAFGLLRRKKFALTVIDLSLTPAILAKDTTPGHMMDQPLDGFRLLAVAQAAHIPTVVISGLSAPAEIEQAYSRYNIYAYVEKQAFDRRAFLQMVQEIRPDHGGPGDMDLLTEREMEVLELLAQGLTNKEIGERLVIAPNTVKRHVKAIFEKLDIHTRAAAAAKMSAMHSQK